MFKNKTIGFYVGLGGGAVGFVTAVIYLIYTLTVGLFAPQVFVMLLLGAAVCVLSLFFEWKFLPLVAVLFFSLAFGLHILDRITMFQEMLNHIYGMNERGAILGVVVLLLIFNFVSIAACAFASFCERDKNQTA